jgi:hypothetical protein
LEDLKSDKSGTEFVTLLGTRSTAWISKFQAETVLSTMESEYVALSQALQILLSFRELLQEICGPLNLVKDANLMFRSTIFKNNEACYQLATTDLPLMTPRSKAFL